MAPAAPSLLLLLLLLLLLPPPPARAAHLPAVRPTPRDEKRALASRLLRAADTHKQRSLRDVLRHVRPPGPRAAERHRLRAARPPSRPAPPDPAPRDDTDDNDARLVFRTVSHLFAWAINNTVAHGRNVSLGTATPHAGGLASLSAPRAPARRALPPPPPSSRARSRARPRAARRADAAALGDLQRAARSEADVVRRSVAALSAGAPPRAAVRALLLLEELCHSIDNGRDLQRSGGVAPLVAALRSAHVPVRASAAWALATCCQNNPGVQHAALALDAVPALAGLAAGDASVKVRSRALFALNAMLENEQARVAFEELPNAVDVLRNALLDASDHRATRRALNLTELLVRRNLDAWKTQLEAWDIPFVIEKLMRSHPDIDVRESAARTIAALDGRTLA